MTAPRSWSFPILVSSPSIRFYALYSSWVSGLISCGRFYTFAIIFDSEAHESIWGQYLCQVSVILWILSRGEPLHLGPFRYVGLADSYGIPIVNPWIFMEWYRFYKNGCEFEWSCFISSVDLLFILFFIICFQNQSSEHIQVFLLVFLKVFSIRFRKLFLWNDDVLLLHLELLEYFVLDYFFNEEVKICGLDIG